MSEKKKGWLFWKENSPEKILTANPAMLSGALGIEILIRELIQNSRDAHDGNVTVEMVAEEGKVPNTSIYDALCLDDLRKHIQGTIDFAQGENSKNERIISKSKSQLKLLEKDYLRYFKFSDFNTKGIPGIEKYDGEKAFWKLLFQEGTSDKPDSSSGGGVGVGKNATFPFSGLSSVIYVTRTDEGYGLAGSSRLASSKVDGHIERMNGRLVSYGESLDNILDCNDFDSLMPISFDEVASAGKGLFKRDQKGTDVIILGTDENAKFDNEEWPFLMAAYAIKNFFVAFLEKKIALTIKAENCGEIRIDENAPKIIDKLASRDGSAELSNVVEEAKTLLETYKGAKGGDDFSQIHEDGMEGVGPVTLYLNKSKDVTVRQWSIYRSFGMRTISKNVKTQRPVAGVLVIEGEPGNELLLRAEAGNHTEYDFSSLGESRLSVKKTIENLENWVSGHLKQFGQFDSSETDIELAGLTNFISLEEDIKISGDYGTGTEPLMKVVEEPAQSVKKKKSGIRKRDSKRDDPDSFEGGGLKAEEWNHDPNHEHNWDHERETAKDAENSSSDGKRLITYDKTLNVSATFRDIHAPYAKEVEIIGRIGSASFKKIDLHIAAVDEQSKENNNLPSIEGAIDLNTGECLTDISENVLKNIIINDDKYMHIRVFFKTPFRAMLLEYATVTKTYTIEIPNSKKESFEGKESAMEVVKDESAD